MQDFDTLSEIDQAAVLARLLTLLNENLGCLTIDDVAMKHGRPVAELWAEICAEADTPECTIPYRVRRTGQA